jgi:hypothetical protein
VDRVRAADAVGTDPGDRVVLGGGADLQHRVDTIIAQMTTLSDDARNKVREQTKPYGPISSIEFWIDDRNELLQLGMGAVTRTSKGATTLITLSDLGATPAAAAPDPADTFDIAPLVQHGGPLPA